MKRFFLFLMVLLFVFSTTVYARGGGDSSGGRTKIVWADWALAEDALKPIYEKCIASFTSKNPDIEIEPFTLPYASYIDQMLIATAAGNAPDVIRIKNEWVPEYHAVGAFRDIRSFINKNVLDDFYPGSLDSLTMDGKLIGLSWQNGTYVLFYNKALLSRAGITQLPRTLDELVAAAYKISALGTDARGNKIYGMAIPASGGVESNEGINIYPMLWGYGGDLLDSSKRVNLTNAPAIKAFTTIQKLFVDGISPVGSTFKDTRNLYGQGVLGFVWDTSGPGAAAPEQAAPNKEEYWQNLGTMVIPRESGPNGHAYVSEQSMAVTRTVSDAKMPAVARFLEQQTGYEVLNILYENNQNKTSNRKSVMEAFRTKDNPIFLTCVETSNSIKFFPYVNFIETDKLLSDALTMLAQGRNVNTVMQETQTKIQALFDKK